MGSPLRHGMFRRKYSQSASQGAQLERRFTKRPAVDMHRNDVRRREFDLLSGEGLDLGRIAVAPLGDRMEMTKQLPFAEAPINGKRQSAVAYACAGTPMLRAKVPVGKIPSVPGF